MEAIGAVHGAELIPEDRNGVVLRDFRGLAFPRLLCCWEAAGTAFHVLRVAPTQPASDGGVGDGVRHLANGGKGKDGAALTDLAPSGDNGMGFHRDPRTQGNLRPDQCEGAHVTARADHGTGLDHGRAMDAC